MESACWNLRDAICEMQSAARCNLTCVPEEDDAPTQAHPRVEGIPREDAELDDGLRLAQRREEGFMPPDEGGNQRRTQWQSEVIGGEKKA